jgi:phage/plasmid-like protein (TIGR03299 family)
MPAYFTSGLFVGDGAWHNEGNVIAKGSDLYNRLMAGQVPVDELAQLAGLNWTVEKAALAMRPIGYIPGTSDPLSMDTGHLKEYRAIRRSDTGHVYQMVSHKYNPVQNREIIDFFKEYCEAGHATIETMGSLKNGAVVWCLARLNGQSSKVLDGLDELRGYMLLATSHDSSVTLTGKPTQVRVVCWNTLSAALAYKYHGKTDRAEKTFRMRHSRKFDAAAKLEAQEIMGMAIERIAYANEVSAKLAQVHIDAEGRLEFIHRLIGSGNLLETIVDQTYAADSSDVLAMAIANTEAVDRAALASKGLTTTEREDKLSSVGKAVLDAIINSPGSDMITAKGTLWGAVNGATYYADHSSTARNDDNRTFSAWFGPGQTLKNQAVEIALDMAGFNTQVA